ncbi:MAG TPA: FtsX-like permease family protein [Gemmatimonadaceae bacterium]|nr:FtsX-like permease family protein [Gemmatimonadaceae bacterium]
MLLTLALRSLVRHRVRTLLAVAGVAVSAAMLLDMVMLASGMRESFRGLLLEQGFQLRLAPRGTLPFDTEATIPDAGAAAARLRAHPDVVAVSGVLGGQLHVPVGERTVTGTALGVDPRVQGDYELLEGADVDAAAPASGAAVRVVFSDGMLAATGARLGDTLSVAAGYDPQLRSFAGQRTAVIVGRARFRYLAAGQRATAVALPALQAMRGAEGRDRVSLFLLRTRTGADVDAIRRWADRVEPRATAISTETAMRQVDERLSYFRQLAYILGSVSLVVGFLLVTTLVTVSVNERVGEIAVLRAIGVARERVVAQILVEGLAIMGSGSLLGLGLGLVTARYLNGILSDFPGLPASIDFFLFQPRAAWTALGLLVGAGVLAGIYPSWRGASLPIARTLRQEAVG